MKKTSKKYTINWLDIGKGLIVAMITATSATVLQMIEVWLNSPTFTIDKVSLMLTVKTAIVAGLGYLIKNFFTPAQIIKKDE